MLAGVDAQLQAGSDLSQWCPGGAPGHVLQVTGAL